MACNAAMHNGSLALLANDGLFGVILFDVQVEFLDLQVAWLVG